VTERDPDLLLKIISLIIFITFVLLIITGCAENHLWDDNTHLDPLFEVKKESHRAIESIASKYRYTKPEYFLVTVTD